MPIRSDPCDEPYDLEILKSLFIIYPFVHSEITVLRNSLMLPALYLPR